STHWLDSRLAHGRLDEFRCIILARHQLSCKPLADECSNSRVSRPSHQPSRYRSSPRVRPNLETSRPTAPHHFFTPPPRCSLNAPPIRCVFGSRRAKVRSSSKLI